MLPFPPYRYGNPAAMGKGFVGPLDAYTTGLQSMFLPFRGLTAYVGDCYTIRDTSDDSSQSVGFTASGDCNAFTTIGSAAMAAWLNQTGSNDMSSASNAAQPFVIQNAVNGLPIVRLDGITSLATAVIGDSTYSRTIYAVMRKRSAQTGLITAYGVGINTTGAANFLADSSVIALGGAWGWRADVVAGSILIGGDVTQVSLLVAVGVSSSVGNCYVNNSAPAGFDPAMAFSSATRISTGRATALSDIDVIGIIEYNATHDDATRQAIQTILANKLGIVLS